MARKRGVLPPTTPLLCDHITWLNKLYCNISVPKLSQKIKLGIRFLDHPVCGQVDSAPAGASTVWFALHMRFYTK